MLHLAAGVALALIALALISASATAQHDGSAIPIEARYAYYVRFVCGDTDESVQEGLVRGRYRTQVVIANPGTQPVRFEIRLARSLPFQQSEGVVEPQRDDIPQQSSIGIDCDEIRTLLPGPMVDEFRSGVLVVRAEDRLVVDATISARDGEGEVTGIDETDIAEHSLACDAGFAGPDCSFACLDGPVCTLRIFYNVDGTPRHVTGLGTSLFKLTGAGDGAAVLSRFRDFVFENQALLALGGLPEDGLDHLAWDNEAARAFGPLRTYRFIQTYRGLPVYGPEALLTVSISPTNGAIGFTGTILDARETFAGLDNPIPSDEAEAAIRDVFLTRVRPNAAPADVRVATPIMVAVPQKNTIGYAADVSVGLVPSATVVINADDRFWPDPPVLSIDDLLSEDLTNEQPITVRAQSFTGVDSPYRFNLISADEVTGDVDTDIFGDPLIGSVYEPGVCAGDPAADGCGDIRLGNPEIVMLDARNTTLNDPNEVRALFDPSGAFLADPFSNRYSMQTHYAELINAFRAFQALKTGTWDSFNDGLMGRPQSDFSPESFVPRLLVFERAQDACGIAADGCAGGRLLIGNGAGELPSDLFDIPPHVAMPGGVREGYGMIVHQDRIPNNRSLAHHEFGHTLDSYSGAGTMTANAPASGCNSNGDCVAACLPDTPDESPALAETIAQMTALFLGTHLYEDVGYESCSMLNDVSPGPNTLPLTQGCAEQTTEPVYVYNFQSDRPMSGGVNNGNPTGKCDHTPGYRQSGIFQAWWGFLHGQDCVGPPDFGCESFEVDGPPGLGGTEIAGARAMLYALARGNGQSYVAFFEHMSDFLYCAYDEDTGNRFRTIFARHGVFDGETRPPPNCLCGNTSVDPGEACDAPDLGGATCTSVAGGFTGGTLACTDQCTLDTSACTTCGDGVIEAGEQCDGADVGDATCVSEGFDSGNLSCSASCTIDTSACSDDPPPIPQPSSCPDGGEDGDVDCACEPASLFEPPDGPGSFLSQVADSISLDDGLSCPGDLICGLTFEGETPENQATPVCLECPAAGSGDGSVPYGCPCTQNSDCQSTGVSGPVSGDFGGTSVALTCWGDADGGWSGTGGTCLPQVNEVNPHSEAHPDAGAILTDEREEFARTKWLCKVPCGDLDVTGSSQHECALEDGPISFDYATCIEQSCEGEMGAICANDPGGHCGPFDECRAECDPVNNGLNGSGGNPDCQAYGYPDVWQCTTWLDTPRCGPPECVADPLTSGPGDLVICDALTYGNLTPD